MVRTKTYRLADAANIEYRDLGVRSLATAAE